MNIVPVSNNNVSMQGVPQGWKNFRKKVGQKFLDTLPNASFNDPKTKLDILKNIDERISRPAENRAVMGSTAILMQPTIDAMNPNADKETRRMSVIKDVSKIIVGTSVGIAVRGTCYKIVEKMTNMQGVEKYSKSLLPKNKDYLIEFMSNPKYLTNYRSALSTGLAIAVMLITNFAIDMPLTLLLTNFLNKNTRKKEQTNGVKEAKNEQAA